MSDDLASEHRDAAHLAQLAGKALLSCAPPLRVCVTSGRPATAPPISSSSPSWRRCTPTIPFAPRRGSSTSRARAASGSSTRSTAPGSSASSGDRTGPSMSRCPSEASPSWVPLPCPPSTWCSRPAEPPVLPPHPEGEPPRLVVSRTRPPDVAYDVDRGARRGHDPHGFGRRQNRRRHSRRRRRLRPRRRPVRVGLVRAGRGRVGLRAPRQPAGRIALRYGEPDAWLPDLVVCRPEYAKAVLDVTTAQGRPYW